MITALADSDNPADRALYGAFQAELRMSAGWSQLLRESGRFRLTGRGDINTYAAFAETVRTVIAPCGRSGIIVPTGIATDATTSAFFGDLVATRSLLTVYDFENEDKIFPSVHNQFRFCLLAITGNHVHVDEIRLAFRLRQVPQLADKLFTLSPEDIARLNPNTLTCPVFDAPRNAKIVMGIYRRIPVLWREQPEENPWGLSFLRMLDMANDSGLFHTRDELEANGWIMTGNIFTRDGRRMLPLYEAKLIHHFDSRFSTYEGATQAQINKGTLPRLTTSQHADPLCVPMPRYWFQEFDTRNEQKSKPSKPVYDLGVTSRLKIRHWDRGWMLGWRDICRPADERTLISVLSRGEAAYEGGTLLAFPSGGARAAVFLAGSFASFALDFIARRKVGGAHLKYFTMRQLPVLPPQASEEACSWDIGTTVGQWLAGRVLELTYTAWDLTPFARDLGDDGAPFRWDEERRFAMRAELDAAFFHLYGIERDDVDYIMETFPIVKRRDIERYGSFRTKELILQVYDAMAEAERTGRPYETILDPPPGHGPRHPARAGAEG